MLNSNAVNLLIKNGFCITTVPRLNKHILYNSFKSFIAKDTDYKKNFLQKNYDYAFDGYSFMGQTDNSN